mmetsp:Transcript_12081/g.24558  ORF Transcript_12081/g.24558 Transcript_12081/m.24558 type:complete len:228 (-) Transcript_12081:874-1557(-)
MAESTRCHRRHLRRKRKETLPSKMAAETKRGTIRRVFFFFVVVVVVVATRSIAESARVSPTLRRMAPPLLPLLLPSWPERTTMPSSSSRGDFRETPDDAVKKNLLLLLLLPRNNEKTIAATVTFAASLLSKRLLLLLLLRNRTFLEVDSNDARPPPSLTTVEAPSPLAAPLFDFVAKRVGDVVHCHALWKKQKKKEEKTTTTTTTIRNGKRRGEIVSRRILRRFPFP